MVQGWSGSGFLEYLCNPYLLGGALATLWLTAASITIGLALGLVLALMQRSASRIVSIAASAYVWLFRGTPLLVQLIVIYTGLPQFGMRLSVIEIGSAGTFAQRGRLSGGNHPLWSVGGAGWASQRRQGARDAGPAGHALCHDPASAADHRPAAWQFGERTSEDDVHHLGHINGRAASAHTGTDSGAFPGDGAVHRCGLYYLAMTTAWDFVQRAIERRFGRAYERLSSAADQR